MFQSIGFINRVPYRTSVPRRTCVVARMIAQEIGVTPAEIWTVGILMKISSLSNEPLEMIYQAILISHKLFLYPKK
ncbi:hypothetical protein [Photorhabdus caribbeanensis]|uniref:hypothetical protein n=1 Tax=Photorhabdus caribbeanensis TaxID=1004165 RepID=UPI001BD5772F|nr:hypothetical protein [Photorhabdus caribbeanensis]MBS9424353.1 hypothetical protein [Photorhabdus caribbeanensis]